MFVSFWSFQPVTEWRFSTGTNTKRAIDHYLAEKYTEPTAETAVKIAKELGVSVEYLVTGKNSEIPDTIKPEIINLIRDMNHLPDKDIEFIKEMIRRLILSVDKS